MVLLINEFVWMFLKTQWGNLKSKYIAKNNVLIANRGKQCLIKEGTKYLMKKLKLGIWAIFATLKWSAFVM